jgi:hypothetical protein
MLTKKFAVVLAGLVVLTFVVSAGGAPNEKSIPAILDNILTELQSIHVKLDGLVNTLPPKPPDLVPLPWRHHEANPELKGPADFCKDGRPWVQVCNLGAGEAGPSVTELYFRVPPGTPVQKSCGDGCAQVDVFTPAMDFCVVLAFPIPEGCFGSNFGLDDVNNCLFKINVDATNVLNESNELNNLAFGACQGLV